MSDDATTDPHPDEMPAPLAPEPVRAPEGEPLLGNVPDDVDGDPSEIGHEETDGLSG